MPGDEMADGALVADSIKSTLKPPPHILSAGVLMSLLRVILVLPRAMLSLPVLVCVRNPFTAFSLVLTANHTLTHDACATAHFSHSALLCLVLGFP